MISEIQFQNELQLIIQNALREDVGDGDHSSLACIPNSAVGKAKLLVKDTGIIAGVVFAKMIFEQVDPSLKLETYIKDGEEVTNGDVVFVVSGSSQSILKAERLVLNSMQRMSAIATKTKSYVDLLKGTQTKILDTRKTTPGFRACEKWAVKIGGGVNHRFGLYDQILIKDNHIKAAGDIKNALANCIQYLKVNHLQIPVVVEVKDLEEFNSIKEFEIVDRILVDNFKPNDITELLKHNTTHKTIEASGGINGSNIIEYAKTGIDYVSLGDLTHHVNSIDISLKII